MNTVQVMGFLGADPEVRYTPNNHKVTSLSIADSQYNPKNKDGDTIWWRCTVWGDAHDRILNHVKKGSAVIVTGQLKPLEYFTNSKTNERQTSLNITVESVKFSPFGRKDDDKQESQGQSQAPQQQAQPQAPGVSSSQLQYPDEDLPF